MAASTIAKAPPFSLPRSLTYTLRIWSQFLAGTAGGGEVGTLELTHPLLVLLDRIDGSPKLFDQVHAQLLLAGIFHHPNAAGRALKCLVRPPSSSPARAARLFAELDAPDAFAANTVLRALLASVGPAAALRFYRRLAVPKGVVPNHYTLPLLAKACAGVGDRIEGAKVHGSSVKLGLSRDLFVQNSLVRMYFCFRMVGCVGKVFDEMIERDMVTWNSMIDGYAKNGMLVLARQVFDEMPERDLVSWNSLISGCMDVGDVDGAEELFVAMPERDMVSWNTMIEGYVRVEMAEVAVEVFERMPGRNRVSWNIILALYVRMKKYDECLKLFDGMMDSGEAMPDKATFVSVVTACAHTGELEKGKLIHSCIRKEAGIVPDLLLSTTLLTMYAKCGDMEMARLVFDEMWAKSVVSWNSMIMGYAVNGMVEKSIEMFVEMEKQGQMPNDVTFICLLSACVHGGMVLEGWWYFDRMHRIYKIKPKIEHYGCMVDLFGRAGLLNDSKELIESMAMEPALPLLGALSSACRNHNSFAFGEIVCKKIMELEPSDIGPYVLLSNMYAAQGRWEDVEKVRESMKDKGLQKTAGLSLVDHSEPHLEKFALGEMNHKRRMIYSMLGEMGSMMKSYR